MGVRVRVRVRCGLGHRRTKACAALCNPAGPFVEARSGDRQKRYELGFGVHASERRHVVFQFDPGQMGRRPTLVNRTKSAR